MERSTYGCPRVPQDPQPIMWHPKRWQTLILGFNVHGLTREEDPALTYSWHISLVQMASYHFQVTRETGGDRGVDPLHLQRESPIRCIL